MQMGHRLSALLQLHLHFRLNAWLQWTGQRQLQGGTRNIEVLGFGVPYTRGLVVFDIILFGKAMLNFDLNITI